MSSFLAKVGTRLDRKMTAAAESLEHASKNASMSMIKEKMGKVEITKDDELAELTQKVTELEASVADVHRHTQQISLGHKELLVNYQKLQADWQGLADKRQGSNSDMEAACSSGAKTQSELNEARSGLAEYYGSVTSELDMFIRSNLKLVKAASRDHDVKRQKYDDLRAKIKKEESNPDPSKLNEAQAKMSSVEQEYQASLAATKEQLKMFLHEAEQFVQIQLQGMMKAEASLFSNGSVLLQNYAP